MQFTVQREDKDSEARCLQNSGRWRQCDSLQHLFLSTPSSSEEATFLFGRITSSPLLTPVQVGQLTRSCRSWSWSVQGRWRTFCRLLAVVLRHIEVALYLVGLLGATRCCKVVRNVFGLLNEWVNAAYYLVSSWEIMWATRKHSWLAHLILQL